MTKKKNVWKTLEKRLRDVFPYPWPDHVNQKDEADKNDYYDAGSDPLIPFLTGKSKKRAPVLPGREGIEFVELAGSFYENVDYDSIPQGTEDECNSVICVDGAYYKVGLIFTSWRGYCLDNWAQEVSPKVVEVVIYE